ncbi:MAG: DEAD/DEAH box helicase [Limnochordia bacterium]|nr:DEAD/DEAH box helicase [Limnochordia bacterium]
MKRIEVGSWIFSTEHRQWCQVIDTQKLWGNTSYRVWLPEQDAVLRINAEDVRTMDELDLPSADQLTYVAAAAKIADSLTGDVLLAPLDSSVIPLPHQIRALSRAMSGDRVRYLLADEVGLGKTIEAGLIMRELKLRGKVKRTLVIAPRGLVTQWVAELKTHFNEELRLLIPGEFAAYRQVLKEDNIWRSFPQVVCPVDSVKPLDSRRGWSEERIAKYNEERYEDLISAGWDLIIVDEAHRLAGGHDQVARYKLGQGLAEAAPYLLLLSATPHQGKTDAFCRLMSLLDARTFIDEESITRERIQPYVIRTEKRQAIDAQGKPLFKPRRTQLIAVPWGLEHAKQNDLYDAVTDYVRKGYDQAMREKHHYIGFLMILMQRLVASSTRAIRVTLKRRLETLSTSEKGLSLLEDFPQEEWAELDGEEQTEILVKLAEAVENEQSEVKWLLDMAMRCEEEGPDVKAEALLDWIYRLQEEEREPSLKVLIFTEFVSTQEMLYEFLTGRGFLVTCLNGSMDMHERKAVQEHFTNEARILISTDAGGEGLNLQFCHVVINYDIPWNPMRLEQRIGRVDRIGQTRVVRAINLVLEDSVEHRILEVLTEKLAVILRDLGVDKTSDVLDSGQSAELFDELYINAILDPTNLEASLMKNLNQFATQAKQTKESALILGDITELKPDEAQRLSAHPLPDWVERMTTSFIRAHGGKAERLLGEWNLIWPDGEEAFGVVFTAKEARANPFARHLTLEEPRVRGLVMRLPRFAQGQPIPIIELAGMPVGVCGFWSLWEISIHTRDWNRRSILPLFVHDDGRILMPTARRIWDQLLSESIRVKGHLTREKAEEIFIDLVHNAKVQGQETFQELLRAHRQSLEQERAKGNYFFSVRREAIEKHGLSTVRRHRLKELEQELAVWQKQMVQKSRTIPDLIPLMILRLEEGRYHV